MSYERKTEKNFSCPFLPWQSKRRSERNDLALRKVGLLMQQAYLEF